MSKVFPKREVPQNLFRHFPSEFKVFMVGPKIKFCSIFKVFRVVSAPNSRGTSVVRHARGELSVRGWTLPGGEVRSIDFDRFPSGNTIFMVTPKLGILLMVRQKNKGFRKTRCFNIAFVSMRRRGRWNRWTRGTSSTSHSPRRQWLTVYRGS